MKSLAFLLLLLAMPVLAEPAYYEVFDAHKCLRWKIDNEMPGSADAMPAAYRRALNLANRQPYSRHRRMTAEEQERMYREHANQVVVVYSARAYDRKQQLEIEKFGACSPGEGLRCLSGQDFPLAGGSYRKAPSRSALGTAHCVAGCTRVPAELYDTGYENMGNERNVALAQALARFERKCGKTQ